MTGRLREAELIEAFLKALAKGLSVPAKHELSGFELGKRIIAFSNEEKLKNFLFENLADNDSFRRHVLPWRWLVLIAASELAAELSSVKIMDQEYAQGLIFLLYQMGTRLGFPAKLVATQPMSLNLSDDLEQINYKKQLLEFLGKIVSLAPDQYSLENIKRNIESRGSLKLNFNYQSIRNYLDFSLCRIYKKLALIPGCSPENLFSLDSDTAIIHVSEQNPPVKTQIDPLTQKISHIITQDFHKIAPMFSTETIANQVISGDALDEDMAFLTQLQIPIEDCIQPKLIKMMDLPLDVAQSENPPLFTIDEILKTKKAIIIGKPGIGKSVLMAQITFFVNTQLEQTGLLAVPVDALLFKKIHFNSLRDYVIYRWKDDFKENGLELEEVSHHLDVLSQNDQMIWLVDNLDFLEPPSSDVFMDMLRRYPRLVVFFRPVLNILTLKAKIGSQADIIMLDYPDFENMMAFVQKMSASHPRQAKILKAVGVWIKKTGDLVKTPAGMISIIAASVDRRLKCPEFIYLADRCVKSGVETPKWVLVNQSWGGWGGALRAFRYQQNPGNLEQVWFEITPDQITEDLKKYLIAGLIFPDPVSGGYTFPSYDIFCWLMGTQYSIPISVDQLHRETQSDFTNIFSVLQDLKYSRIWP